MRIAFATNDERTAKRIFEALGTATELRAQRNYAGHRLAPWLGHLMVSRQETARPSLTLGEVMQLPLDEDVVMVSGHPPIKAAKLRYYQDRNFMAGCWHRRCWLLVLTWIFQQRGQMTGAEWGRRGVACLRSAERRMGARSLSPCNASAQTFDFSHRYKHPYKLDKNERK